MNLKDYFQSGTGLGKALADGLGIDQSYLSQIASGDRKANPERCVQIEKLTKGAVTRRDLRPHDYAQIWPELARKTKQAA